jgi:hypothetical protein
VKRKAITASNSNTDLKINVSMTMPVTVLDSMGRSVTGLGPLNFKLFDTSHQVKIASFARQDQPIAVGLVFDCSRSVTDKFHNEREAPRQLFEQLGREDASFLVTVSDRAELRPSRRIWTISPTPCCSHAPTAILRCSTAATWG